jgi:hypothetical protein
MRFTTLFITTILTLTCFGSIQKQEKEPPKEKSPFAPRLDMETYLTNTNGVANPAAILYLKPADIVKIYLTDGRCVTGIVKTHEYEKNKMIKMFGDAINYENTAFGFYLTVEGIFAGAIAFRDEGITYAMEYSEAAKGFILVKR